MGVPMDVIKAPGILRTLELVNHKANSLQIKLIRTVLTCTSVTSWSFTHRGIMVVPMGVIRAHEIMKTPKLNNHWADSLKK